MLIVQSASFAQTLPVKTIIGGDTAVIITLDQAKAINTAFIELDGCNEEKTRLQAIIDTSAKIVSVQGDEISTMDAQMKLQKDITSQQHGVIADLDKEIKKLQNTDKISKFERNILFIGAAYLAARLFIK